MDHDEFAARLAALEKYVKQLAQSSQQPLLDLIDWGLEERFNELGRTRGKLLALEALVRAIARTAKPSFGKALELAIEQAEADLLTLVLPEKVMAGATEAFNETAAALRRDLAAPRAVGQ